MFVFAAALMLGIQISDPPALRVTIDSAQRTVTLSAGPFTIAGANHDAGGGGHTHGGAELPLLPFEMPIDGWLRGVRMTLHDDEGRPLDRRLVHHVNVINFARRQLFYPAVERTLALGQETEDIRLPATVGIPVSTGMPMALILAWHNPDHAAVEGVTVELVMEYLPHNQNPRPVSALPSYMDVVDPVAKPVDFDLPTGKQRFTAELAMPINARIIGVGGHMHDFATGLTLEELRDGSARELVSLKVMATPEGALERVERQLPGVRGRGIRLREGTTYRVTGSYDNPTGKTIPKGAMVHLVMLVAPDKLEEWPAATPDNPNLKRDMEWLQSRGKE